MCFIVELTFLILSKPYFIKIVIFRDFSNNKNVWKKEGFGSFVAAILNFVGLFLL